MTDETRVAARGALIAVGWLPPVRDLPMSYDTERDLLTIAGVRYAGGVFRGLGLATLGRWFRLIERREDGAITLESAPEVGQALPERERGEGPAKEADGCPTEGAVLQREWRWHREAFKFIHDLAEEEYPMQQANVGAEIVLRHIIRWCEEVL